jgi:hypothetical protein
LVHQLYGTSNHPDNESGPYCQPCFFDVELSIQVNLDIAHRSNGPETFSTIKADLVFPALFKKLSINYHVTVGMPLGTPDSSWCRFWVESIQFGEQRGYARKNIVAKG